MDPCTTIQPKRLSNVCGEIRVVEIPSSPCYEHGRDHEAWNEGVMVNTTQFIKKLNKYPNMRRQSWKKCPENRQPCQSRWGICFFWTWWSERPYTQIICRIIHSLTQFLPLASETLFDQWRDGRWRSSTAHCASFSDRNTFGIGTTRH